MSTILKELSDNVVQCQENCYSHIASTESELNQYDAIINRALQVVYETITDEKPFGLISMTKAFEKIQPLPPNINGKKLSYDLGRGLNLLKPYSEVGYGNWVLTKAGLERIRKTGVKSSPLKPLIDQDRKYLINECNQIILFISEAPSVDAWEKQVLVDETNNFLIDSLLPQLAISLEEFRKYFFWCHYSNCFPGTTANGNPKKPKDSKCFDKHTANFLTKINWKGIILMGEYAYRSLGYSEPYLEYLKKAEPVPSKLFPNIDTPVMVVPHCSGRNTKARSELGSTFNLLWDNANKFVCDIIKSSTMSLEKDDIENIVDQRVRECLLLDQKEPKEKKILILGDSQIEQKVIFGIVKKCGISPDRIELKIDYQKNKRFDIGKLQFSDTYDCLLIGPNSHKMVNLGNYDSLIARLKSEDGFPDHIELRELSGELKITKESLRKALKLLG